MPRNSNPRSARNIDAEAGRPKLKSTKKSKKQYVSSASEAESESEPELQVTRKKLVKKPFKEDARRQIFEEDSASEEDEEETPRSKGKTTKSKVSGTTETAQAEGSIIASYTAMFVAFDQYGIILPRQLEISRYGVSFFHMFTILHAMELSLYGNTRINATLAEYFSLPARIYYAYMGLYQILRAKTAAGIALPALQRRIFRRLETELPLESCPIAGPLVPWFQSLGCFKPSDDAYGMIRPLVPGPGANSVPLTRQTSDMYYFPPIPVMIAFLDALARIPTSGNAAARNFMSNAGYLIPVTNDGAGTAVAFLNAQWETDGVTASHRDILDAFSRPGLSLALTESTETLSSGKKLALRRMNLPAVTHNTDVSDLEKYIFFDAGRSIEWLKRCREHASAQARFFSGRANLMQISPTTDADPTVICDLQANAAAPAVLLPYEQEQNGYTDLAVASNTLSGNITEMEFKRATLNKILLPTAGTAALNVFPATWNPGSTTIDGPWYRHTAGETTTANDRRLRYRQSTTNHHNADSEIKSIVRQHLYNPNGADPELVRIVA